MFMLVCSVMVLFQCARDYNCLQVLQYFYFSTVYFSILVQLSVASMFFLRAALLTLRPELKWFSWSVFQTYSDIPKVCHNFLNSH